MTSSLPNGWLTFQGLGEEVVEEELPIHPSVRYQYQLTLGNENECMAV